MSSSTYASPQVTAQAGLSPEDEIRALYAQWIDAFRARDIDRLMSLYDPDVRIFDAIPPHEHRGSAAYRASWEMCLPDFPEDFGLLVARQEISVSGELAVMSTFYRITGMEHFGDCGCTWLRGTYALRRGEDGRWLIVHEHNSVPFDPFTNQAAFILEDFRND